MARQAIYQHTYKLSYDRAIVSRRACRGAIPLNGNERDKACLAAIEQAEMVRPIFLLGCTSERVRRVIAGNDPAIKRSMI
jgi:hypothetical protein